MGRRSINTTKSGKYMNPTDQARLEFTNSIATRSELMALFLPQFPVQYYYVQHPAFDYMVGLHCMNKKQRQQVRLAVLKGKDPRKIFEEMELIDAMEFDVNNPPKLSERVLKEKRGKLKGTLIRVLKMQEKEDPALYMEMRKAEREYEVKRLKMKQHYDEVKNAESVSIDEIPLPDASGPGMSMPITLPGEIPLPGSMPEIIIPQASSSILKKTSVFDKPKPAASTLPAATTTKRKLRPPGPPPQTPPMLSDSEDEGLHFIGFLFLDFHYSVQVGNEKPMDTLPTLEEVERELSRESRSRRIRFEDDSTHDPDEPEKDTRLKAGVSKLQMMMLKMAGQQIPRDGSNPKPPGDDSDDEAPPGQDMIKTDAMIPPGPPPGLPPGPPPGLPPMMFRPPPSANPSRMLPPGPPPGRPPGVPPGPPPGLPPSARAPRLPPGPPGVAPPRLRPPGLSSFSSGKASGVNPNILSAPPNILKPPQHQTSMSASMHKEDESKSRPTIEAKPQIKYVMGEATRFMPTALKVKREVKDAKGRLVRQQAKEDTHLTLRQVPAVAAPTKDDAYDSFMKEMENYL
ncbi:hypothetical protein CAPTEDRAFT_220578 [Capitella teleta]|uniref:Uncharacterized protein n=1 Tax=Capitella teleta TaxID=283909 RepID=R7TLL7_CAPTE|nr:hypothetical protein CAPTEDRAFT_220578 [Capitella teleta]|eukprot:ELT92000.1 hypothetical protein CAPTEDRAFT_220578 [Capitella teleta]